MDLYLARVPPPTPPRTVTSYQEARLVLCGPEQGSGVPSGFGEDVRLGGLFGVTGVHGFGLGGDGFAGAGRGRRTR